MALKASVRKGVASAEVLKAHVPTIHHQIVRTARFEQVGLLWGLSRNYDEIAEGEIVREPIVRMIGMLCGESLHDQTFNAGYLHTYGYLFSTLPTPYGLKRDRWIRPQLDDRLGFREATIRIHPRRGSLLMNLTWLLGSLVFDPESPEFEALQTFRGAVPNAVLRFRSRSLRRDRIIERPALADFEIVTDLLHFDGGGLLIYSIRTSSDARVEGTTPSHRARHRGEAKGQHRLYTAFPIAEDFCQALLDPHRFGPGKRDIELRFNAVVPGFSGSKHRGERALAQPPSGKKAGTSSANT